MGQHERTMIAVDPDALSRIEAQMAHILSVLSEPKREWLDIHDAERKTGWKAAKIRRMAQTGAIETRGDGKARRYWV